MYNIKGILITELKIVANLSKTVKTKETNL